MKAQTRSGEIELTDSKVLIRRTGKTRITSAIKNITSSVVSSMLMRDNSDEIELSNITQVEFSEGKPVIIHPRIKIYHEGKVRVVFFKKPSNPLDYKGAVAEMKKVISEFERKEIPTMKKG